MSWYNDTCYFQELHLIHFKLLWALESHTVDMPKKEEERVATMHFDTDEYAVIDVERHSKSRSGTQVFA